VFLKSLTLRGFKSFADRTDLAFEPGITVVVGPNGSGKSNVVDALTWVLGTGSAKALRGAAMSDVIFAGSGGGRRQGRSALGRASVEITIDNAAGTLPIDFSEVTVGRAMFANGENTYTINGEECRLLDVQELLSDTGLGRENHTIVGQGQLDTVLNARPEDRRAFIEEAAGILKHRRRKERALRKLAQTEQHLERLSDLLRELRRQLRPLERQAEAAARHAELTASLQRVRVALAVRDLAALTARLAAEDEGGGSSAARLAEVEARLGEARDRHDALERELSRQAPAARAAAEVHFRLANQAERSRGLVDRIAERTRGLAEAVEEPVAGRDPAELRARAAEAHAQRDGAEAERGAASAAVAAAGERRQEAERARRAHEQAAAAEARRRAQARERRLRWEGSRATLASGLAQSAGEQGRLASQVAGLADRIAELERDEEAAAAAAEDHAGDAQRLGAEADAARAAADRGRSALAAAAAAEREADRAVARLQARAEALRAQAVPAGAGAGALAGAGLPGLLGPLAGAVTIDPSLAPALSAALGPLRDALVTDSHPSAAAALAHVVRAATPRVTLLPAPAAARRDAAPAVERPPGPAPATATATAASSGSTSAPALEAALGGSTSTSTPALATPGGGEGTVLAELVGGDERVVAALRPLLRDVVLVGDLDSACRLAAAAPDRTFVTAAGEVAGRGGYSAGSAGTDPVGARALAAEADREAEAAAAVLASRQADRAAAEAQAAELGAAAQAATAAAQEARGLARTEADRRDAAARRLAAARRDRDLLQRQRDDLDRQVAERRARLAELEAAPPEEADEGTAGAGDLDAERLDDALARAREAEVEARLALSEVEQRAAQLARTGAALEQEAADVERRLADRERRRAVRLAALDRCAALAVVAADALARSQHSLDLAARDRDRQEELRGRLQRDLGALRARLRDLEAARGELVAARHAEDLRRQELSQQIAAVRARLADLGVDPEDARDAEGSDEELAEAEATLARKLGLLGTVNHLAVEEFSALQERHGFLSGELDDLRASRRDLVQVVDAVDDRIREVFTAAFADVAANFDRIFPRLFPGGEGRLVLTEPGDLLETGVEIEARPAGKRVKRLSLLSGGERSLTALALLFAIFAARPSPFYVLDEVEAALDDVNLQRFLDVLAGFKSSAQLIVVTHQRRTMEIADTLYGVSMRGDGVSRVVHQRLGGDDLRLDPSDEVRLPG